MQTIIIGAGRGRRLEHLTSNEPKCFTKINNKRILDWIILAFRSNSLINFTFIGGYLIEVVKKNYPEFEFRQDVNWSKNNSVLQSLFYAADKMDNGFICTYSDTLYNSKVINKLLNNPADIVVAIDTKWQERYRNRLKHPTKNAEKVTVAGPFVTRFHRQIVDSQAFGEFIGLVKFSSAGAKIFKETYENLDVGFKFDGVTPIFKAYLIDYLDYLVYRGVKIEHITTAGDYIEVDTLEDYEYAQKHWFKN